MLFTTILRKERRDRSQSRSLRNVIMLVPSQWNPLEPRDRIAPNLLPRRCPKRPWYMVYHRALARYNFNILIIIHTNQSGLLSILIPSLVYCEKSSMCASHPPLVRVGSYCTRKSGRDNTAPSGDICPTTALVSCGRLLWPFYRSGITRTSWR